MSKWTPTIGIECHVQLKTKTKLFSAVGNDAREAEPNTLVSPICFGMPGVLPVLNEAVIDLSIAAGIALNAQIAEFSKFDRKHYFYPDLPMGYQITQFDQPIILNGEIEVPLDDGFFTVKITRAHLEADAGKSIHPTGKDYSLVDLNRAGTPLLEIVSEPDMHSAKEARAYVKELYYLIKYSGASDADLYYGNMRFDVNVSVSDSGAKLGVRTETKNLNSFRSVERAVDYEIARQIEVIESGGEVIQETRGWDDEKNRTFSQRSKEDAHDYRYFPDPDLPPIVIDQQRIEKVRKQMPVLPPQIRKTLLSSGVDNDRIDTLLDNEDYINVVMAAIDRKLNAKTLSRIVNWLSVDVKSILNETGMSSQIINLDEFVELSDMIDAGELSSTAAKDVLAALMADNDASAKETAMRLNLIQVSDTSEIEGYVDSVLKENPKAVEDIINGETKAIGFLVGQVMKISKGQANPSIVNKMINQKINQK